MTSQSHLHLLCELRQLHTALAHEGGQGILRRKKKHSDEIHEIPDKHHASFETDVEKLKVLS